METSALHRKGQVYPVNWGKIKKKKLKEQNDKACALLNKGKLIYVYYIVLNIFVFQSIAKGQLPMK